MSFGTRVCFGSLFCLAICGFDDLRTEAAVREEIVGRDDLAVPVVVDDIFAKIRFIAEIIYKPENAARAEAALAQDFERVQDACQQRIRLGQRNANIQSVRTRCVSAAGANVVHALNIAQLYGN